MSELPSKQALKDELVRLLAADLDTLARAQEAAIEGATHEEAKPENDKDTRALEASYLARGQALRLEELRAGLAEVEAMPVRAVAPGGPAALGALVTAEEGEGTATFLVAPHGGGAKLAGGRVQVVTPRSPLGRALLGKREGDDCEVAIEGRRRELAIVGVA
jgi:transcription elongation GreA/GreB family factor